MNLYIPELVQFFRARIPATEYTTQTAVPTEWQVKDETETFTELSGMTCTSRIRKYSGSSLADNEYLLTGFLATIIRPSQQDAGLLCINAVPIHFMGFLLTGAITCSGSLLLYSQAL